MKKRRLREGVYFMPEELMVKILERLPTKSLIRFTSVSKHWRSIILDPEFGKSHFRIMDSDNHYPRHVTLFSPDPKVANVDKDFDPLYLDLFSHSSLRRKLKFPFIEQPSTSTNVTLISSCNGLLCVLVRPGNHLYIWNPSTNFFRKLPDPVDYSSLKRETLLVVHGFGYVSASKEYKLVVQLKQYHLPDIFIYSSKTNVWRRIRNMVHLLIDAQGILSHENLHWHDKLDKRIAAFDLATEKFRRMQLPNVDAVGFLHAYGDTTLCVFDMRKFSTLCRIHMWVMEEYNVACSWRKLFKLKISDGPENITMLRPIFVHETSTFLLKRTVDDRRRKKKLKLIRSFHNEDRFDRFVLRGPQRNYMQVIDYQETLLSFDY